MTAIPILLPILLATSPCPNAVISEGSAPHCVSRQFSFTEGPTALPDGRVLFTDQNNNNVWLWDERDPDSVTLWGSGLGRANGMCCNHNDQTLWLCADERMELWQMPLTSRALPKTKIASFGAKPFNGPNDVYATVHGIFFTDPFYARAWWSHKTPPQSSAQVYALYEGHPIRLTDDLIQPNGIIGTPDGKMLFVSDIKAGKTYRYSIERDGTRPKLTQRTLFCNQGSDGMTIDCEGRLYLTGREGVYIYDRNGAFLGTIPVPEPWTANVCFGGSKRDTLCITASRGFYTIKTRTHGLPHGK